VSARNLVGPIPEPEDLYGRDTLLAHAWRVLHHNNVLFLAPRRFGKSGVMRHMLRRPQGDYLPLSFDLEDVTSAPEFIARVVEGCRGHPQLRPLLERAGDAVKGFLAWIPKQIEEVGAGQGLPHIKFRESVEKDWEGVARRVMHELEQADAPLLFIFDELPEMLKKIARAKGEAEAVRFISWFRTVRLDEREALRRHRFVVGGSTGLNYLLDRRLGCPETFNDFQRLTVDPLDFPTAERLCRDLAASYGLTVAEEPVKHLLAVIGQPVPYFIQLVFSMLSIGSACWARCPSSTSTSTGGGCPSTPSRSNKRRSVSCAGSPRPRGRWRPRTSTRSTRGFARRMRLRASSPT
jgi:hypothetical protein